MEESVRRALATDSVVDITTRGRSSGTPRRIEIWIHEAGGRYFITGRPGRRGWHANLVADPALTVHVKQSAGADLPARAHAITGRAEREAVLRSLPRLSGVIDDSSIGDWLERSPLVEIRFD